jgi:hypothetical protein
MASNRPDTMEKKNDKQRDMPAPDPKKGPEKRKKDLDSDERKSGFRSSRIRESESRTSDTGDPSVS